MDMKQLINLKNQRTVAVEGMEKAREKKLSAKASGDKAAIELARKEFEASKALVSSLNEDIQDGEDSILEKGRFEDNDTHFIDLGLQKESKKQDQAVEKSVDSIRSEPEYAKVWAKALRAGMTVKKSLGNADYAILHKALTVSGGTTPGEDGGFLVPTDFDGMIVREVKDYVDLAALCNVETVSLPTGWRAVEVAGQRTKLPVIGENALIGKQNQPKFRKVNYSVKKYGDRLVVSSELLEDNTAGLMQYLAGWFAPKYILTKNDLVLTILEGLSFTAQTATTDKDKVKALKRILNKGLNTAYSRGATLLTNQNVYDEMDNWVDAQNRAMLVPDLSGNFDKFKGRPVVCADNDEIGTVTKDTKVYDPLFVGNLKAAVSVFIRKTVEVAATDVGGDAWANDAYELRCLCRMDAQSVDSEAVVFTGYAQA